MGRSVESIATGGDSKIPARDTAMWLRYPSGGGNSSTRSCSDRPNRRNDNDKKERPHPVTKREIRRSLELYRAWETAMHQRYFRFDATKATHEGAIICFMTL